jgi:hypothetical protein
LGMPVLLYAMGAYVAAMRGFKVDPEMDILIYVFVGVGTVAAVASLFLKRAILANPRPTTTGGATRTGVLAQAYEVDPVRAPRVGTLFSATIVSYALSINPLLFGFITLVMGTSYWGTALLAGEGILFCLLNFPRLGAWLDYALAPVIPATAAA